MMQPLRCSGPCNLLTRPMKRLTLALALVLALAAPVGAGPYEDAVDAYDREDYATALQLLRPLAEQGHAQAQAFLGLMYATGGGVPKDDVRAHMWFDLAASQGNLNGAASRNLVAREMTPAQIAEAQKLAREWRPK